jgi:hypothetical protein
VSAALQPKAGPPVEPLPKVTTPLRTFRIIVAKTGRVLRCGFAGDRVQFGPAPHDPAEFTSHHQAAWALIHIERRMNEPFYALGLEPGARIVVIAHDWIDAYPSDINDCGVRVRKTAVDAAYLDVQGQPAWLSAVRRVWE